MFDGESARFTDRRSDKPPAGATLPWQGVALLVCLAILSVVAAILYPDVFGAPLEQFVSTGSRVVLLGVLQSSSG